MLPGSLDAGGSARLGSPYAAQAAQTVWPNNIIRAPVTAACCILRVVSMWHERTASRHVLARLDDHLLEDIGLTRVDVERELKKPFWTE